MQARVFLALLGCAAAQSEIAACSAVGQLEEDAAMVQLKGVKGVQRPQGWRGGAAWNSKPFFYEKGASPEASALIINEDGVNNTYYLPGAPILDGGMRVKFEPPYRYYLMQAATDDYSAEDNFYQLKLVGKTFSVDIEFTPDGPGCGCNLNFYLVDMPWSTPGSSKDYYCDAQCFSDHGCCAEFDINEGNMHVQQTTNHACTHDYQYPDWVCSKGGNPWDKTHPGQFGTGSGQTIDSRKPFTYSTRFEKTNGQLSSVVTISQEGNEVVLRLGPNDRQMNEMMKEMEQGMVFVTGYWFSENMNWMDGEECGYSAEHCNGHPAYISNWRITTNSAPVPAPPAPAPPPSSGRCCWGGCSSCAAPDNFCSQGGRGRCEGSCGGQWC